MLDIKPGSCPNLVHIGNWDDDDSEDRLMVKGALIEAAVLGSDVVDASLIDPATMTLEGVPALRWSIRDKLTLNCHGERQGDDDDDSDDSDEDSDSSSDDDSDSSDDNDAIGCDCTYRGVDYADRCTCTCALHVHVRESGRIR
jgi:hypothetical protein